MYVAIYERMYCDKAMQELEEKIANYHAIFILCKCVMGYAHHVALGIGAILIVGVTIVKGTVHSIYSPLLGGCYVYDGSVNLLHTQVGVNCGCIRCELWLYQV